MPMSIIPNKHISEIPIQYQIFTHEKHSKSLIHFLAAIKGKSPILLLPLKVACYQIQ